MTTSKLVKEYQETSGQKSNKRLYEDLIEEEFNEWSIVDPNIEPEEDLKELADLVYVVYSYANALGYDLDEAIKRVHENNMARMRQDNGEILRRSDGKIIKNPNTPKVNLEDLV